MYEHKFTKVSELLPQILKKIGLDKKLEEREAVALWEEVVGKDIAARTRAVKLENGELYIHVDHGAWMQELRFMEKDIIEKIEKAVPGVNIKRIRFRTRE
jgi:predicted nucleic acid-binding Zn ribbon protein